MLKEAIKLRPGTATYARGRESVQRILEVAKEIFLGEGYPAVTMRRIARDAQISPGNLSYYYASKDDLMADILQRTLSTLGVHAEIGRLPGEYCPGDYSVHAGGRVKLAGIGQRVLGPFVSSKDRGHGLGLALASRVIAYLGGSLELINPGEPGAEFRVVLHDPDERRDR